MTFPVTVQWLFAYLPPALISVTQGTRNAAAGKLPQISGFPVHTREAWKGGSPVRANSHHQGKDKG